MRGQPPEEELRRRLTAFTELESSMFPQLPNIRVPCCYSVHPAGWCQCLFCGALLQYKGNVVPSAPMAATPVVEDPSVARAAAAAKVAEVGGRMRFRTPKGDFWQHIAGSLKGRQNWKLTTPEQRQGYSVNGWCPWLGGTSREALERRD